MPKSKRGCGSFVAEYRWRKICEVFVHLHMHSLTVPLPLLAVRVARTARRSSPLPHSHEVTRIQFSKSRDQVLYYSHRKMHPKNPYASKKPDFGELGKKYPAFGE